MSWQQLIARIDPIVGLLALATALLPYVAAAFNAVPLRASLYWLPPATMASCGVAAVIGLLAPLSLRLVFLPAAAAVLYFVLITTFPSPLSSLAWDRFVLVLMGLSYMVAFTGVSLVMATVVRELAARAEAWMQRAEPKPSLPPPVPKTMRILLLAANPDLKQAIDLEKEIAAIDKELRGVTYRDAVALHCRVAVTPDDLVHYIRQDRPNVIHFSGHGTKTGILLRSDEGGAATVAGDALARTFKGRDIDLVVLNSCYSQHQAAAIQPVVGAVVGTTDEVEDAAALRYSVAFYRGLGNGLKVSDAARDARDAVDLHALDDVFHAAGNLDLQLTGPSGPADPRT